MNEEEDGETIVATVTEEAGRIAGVDTIVVCDTVYPGLPYNEGKPHGVRIEDTDDCSEVFQGRHQLGC